MDVIYKSDKRGIYTSDLDIGIFVKRNEGILRLGQTVVCLSIIQLKRLAHQADQRSDDQHTDEGLSATVAY